MDALGAEPLGKALSTTPKPAPPKRSQAHYLWAVLIARICEAFPLLCPQCGGQMRIIAFITRSADIRQILDHIGAESEPPNIAPARGPPLWEDCYAQAGEGSQGEPDWDLVGQPAPDFFHCVGCDGLNGRDQWLLSAPNPCHTWFHPIEFPIRWLNRLRRTMIANNLALKI